MALRDGTLRERNRIHDAVIEFIGARYADDISLDDFCHYSHYSRRSVQRALHHFDTTWQLELVGKRIAVAAHMLEHTHKSVRAISEAVGYKQPSHFSTVFNREYNETPMNYRAGARAVAARLRQQERQDG